MAHRILVVDDDLDMQEVYRHSLRVRGFEVDLASDAREGHDKALARVPDAIITDVVMPGMSGFELVRSLRSYARLGTVPILFLTSMADERYKIQGLKLGGDDYLTKPFSFDELASRLERAIQRSQALRKALEQELHERSGGPQALQGSLQGVALASVLALLEMERKSGILTVEADVRGRLWISDGRVLAARLEAAADASTGDPRADAPAEARGVEAVGAMIGWMQGSFSFSEESVFVGDELSLTTTQLLMNVAQAVDELSREG